VKGYVEYLELFEYFGRQGLPRLSRAEFERLDAEYVELVARLRTLDAEERQKLADLKTVLLRDKP
jgi:hypothetical protein